MVAVVDAAHRECRYLGLGYNQLSGTVPSSLGSLTRLPCVGWGCGHFDCVCLLLPRCYRGGVRRRRRRRRRGVQFAAFAAFADAV